MELTAFLRMVDEEVKRHSPAGTRWSLTTAHFCLQLEFVTRDNTRLTSSIDLAGAERIEPAAFRVFVRESIMRLLRAQMVKHNLSPDWRSPWETEY